MVEDVDGDGRCFYVAVQEEGAASVLADPVKKQAEEFYKDNAQELVYKMLQRCVITGDEVGSFDQRYLNHIRTPSSQADLSCMHICAMSEPIDIKLVNAADGEPLALISGLQD